MSKTVYNIITMYDGISVRVGRFEAADPIGVIQIVHGFGEHIGHYEKIADFFTGNRFICVMHEQRGFGEMPGKTLRQRKAARGITPGYEYFLEDVKTIRDKIDAWYPRLPVNLFGFSMGGNISINYLLKYPQDRYKKLVLESPWLSLYKPLPVFIAAIVRLAGRISRKLAVSGTLNKKYISRNPDTADTLHSDTIFHDRISLRLFEEITCAGEYAVKNASRISLPVLLLCGGDDRIVSPKAIREFSGNANENVSFIEYSGGYHCLHLDIINGEVLKAILDFLLQP